MIQGTEWECEKHNENKEFKLLISWRENKNNLTGYTFRDTTQIPREKQP